jgi:hypothetical protein
MRQSSSTDITYIAGLESVAAITVENAQGHLKITMCGFTA